MGFLLLRKRMKSDFPVTPSNAAEENRVRHGSPDSAALPDRRSPEFIRGADDKEDLRSNLSAGSEDPRTARDASTALSDAARRQLPVMFVVWPLVVMLVLFGLMFAVVIAETGTQNVTSFLGFSAIQLLATFDLVSVFRSAWNSSSWVVWIASLLFLPFAASLFGYAASYQDAATLTQWVSALQALTALAYWLGLLFVRPLFVHESDPRLAAQPFRWRRVLALACLLLVPVTALVWLRMTLSVELPSRSTATSATVNTPVDPVIAPSARDPRQPQLDERGFPNAQLLSNRVPSNSPIDPEFLEPGDLNPQTPVANRNSLKPLLGRWVVLTLQGEEPPFAPATAGGMGGMMGGPPGNASTPAATAVTPSTTDQLRSLEFRDGQLFLIDPVHELLSAEVRNDRTLLLQNLSTGESVRHGVFTIADDRLVICWTSRHQPLPRGFQPKSHEQLVVCRREWARPSHTDDKGNVAVEKLDENSKLPKAEMPFSPREAAALQAAWAEMSKSPVEVTNSIGMKLRVIPPGSFGDPRTVATLAQSVGG